MLGVVTFHALEAKDEFLLDPLVVLLGVGKVNETYIELFVKFELARFDLINM